MAMDNLGRITFPPRNVDCSVARRISHFCLIWQCVKTSAVFDIGYLIFDIGYLIFDTGYWILDIGYLILGI